MAEATKERVLELLDEQRLMIDQMRHTCAKLEQELEAVLKLCGK